MLTILIGQVKLAEMNEVAPASNTRSDTEIISVRPGIRWWPFWTVLALAAIAIVAVFLPHLSPAAFEQVLEIGRLPEVGLLKLEAMTFQTRNVAFMSILLIAFLLLLIWFLVFSRARWQKRVLGLLLIVLIGGGLSQVIRVRGFTGDLAPIFEWYWPWKTPVPPVDPVDEGIVTGPEIAPDPQEIAPSPDSDEENLESRDDEEVEVNVEPTEEVEPVQPVEEVEEAGALDDALDATLSGFPQFQGPIRTTVLEGQGLVLERAGGKPEILWRTPVGAAWSGFSVMYGRAVTQEQQGEQEWVSCLNARTGERLWHHTDTTRYTSPVAGEGPRATPTLRDGKVYALGATGRLNCLDLKTGKNIWQVDLVEELGATIPEWGFSGSPWVDEENVYIIAGAGEGKSVAAFRREDGALVWTGGDAQIRNSSLVEMEVGGRSQLLAFNKSLEAVDRRNGQLLWTFPFGSGHPHVATPVVLPEGRVLISAGYGVGAALLQVSLSEEEEWEVTPVWESRRMKAKFSSLVVRDGVLYGLDDGMFAAVSIEDGNLIWKEGRHGHGQGLWIGPDHVLMAENGELLHLRPTREGPGLQSKFRVFRDKTWNPIALAGDHIFVRNDREAACVIF
jgi:outer membrane protein assembly factor BamB